MTDYWVHFEGRKPACITAKSEQDAMREASDLTGFVAVSAQRLPYPAEPRLNKVARGAYGPTPSFCFRPEQCVGRGSCPQRYSCTE
ncbi:MAG: hypothetical protein RIS45_1570 [Planctomycetota bacterium]|jgi:hypothetical protein